MHIYVGTYTDRDSEGIFCCPFDSETGSLGDPVLAAELSNPTFLEIDPGRGTLYTFWEFRHEGRRTGGTAKAFRIDQASGRLDPLNEQPIGGAGPCHISIDSKGRFAFVACYAGGSVAAFPIEADGSLAPQSGFAQHEGSSVNAMRQEGPHAHSIQGDPAGRNVLAADLGADKLFVYRVDDSGALHPADTPSFSLPPGQGPRHFAFHRVADGERVYVINELGNTATVLGYDSQAGTLRHEQEVPTLPAGWEGDSATAEIRVHPHLPFLYGSNRGHDSIVTYRIDPETGHLSCLGHTASGGEHPRNFCIDPSGSFLLSANRDTDNIVVFAIDPESGQLSPTGQSATVSHPVCIRFFGSG
jgi:6-phosphogluconolactonase